VACGNLRGIRARILLEKQCELHNHHPMQNDRPQSWTVTLTPHRSLTREGFVALIAILVLLNFVGGLLFLVAGAWPITGFMGLDVLLIWLAFRRNFADGKRAERIHIDGDRVTLQRLSLMGRDETVEFNRRWLRVELEFDEAREIVGRLLFKYRGAATEIGAFLGAEERQSLSKELRLALA
jgi:uncharacterized membrane protein